MTDAAPAGHIPMPLRYAAVAYSATMTLGLILFFSTQFAHGGIGPRGATLLQWSALHHWTWGITGSAVVALAMLRYLRSIT